MLYCGGTYTDAWNAEGESDWIAFYTTQRNATVVAHYLATAQGTGHGVSAAFFDPGSSEGQTNFLVHGPSSEGNQEPQGIAHTFETPGLHYVQMTPYGYAEGGTGLIDGRWPRLRTRPISASLVTVVIMVGLLGTVPMAATATVSLSSGGSAGARHRPHDIMIDAAGRRRQVHRARHTTSHKITPKHCSRFELVALPTHYLFSHVVVYGVSCHEVEHIALTYIADRDPKEVHGWHCEYRQSTEDAVSARCTRGKAYFAFQEALGVS